MFRYIIQCTHIYSDNLQHNYYRGFLPTYKHGDCYSYKKKKKRNERKSRKNIYNLNLLQIINIYSVAKKGCKKLKKMNNKKRDTI